MQTIKIIKAIKTINSYLKKKINNNLLAILIKTVLNNFLN